MASFATTKISGKSRQQKQSQLHHFQSARFCLFLCLKVRPIDVKVTWGFSFGLYGALYDQKHENGATAAMEPPLNFPGSLVRLAHQAFSSWNIRAGSTNKQIPGTGMPQKTEAPVLPSPLQRRTPLPGHIYIFHRPKLPDSRYTSAARLLEPTCTYNNAWCLHSPVTAHKHAPVTKKRQQESLLLSLSLSLSSYLIMLAKPKSGFGGY